VGNNTSNQQAFFEAEQYSQIILENLHEFLLPEVMYRDITDFPSGTTLNIKTVGDVTIQDTDEDDVLTSYPIDTGTITMAITEFKGAKWHITDKLREDGAQIDQLSGMQTVAVMRAFGEEHQTKYFAAGNAAHTASNLNIVNGRPHRWVAGGAGASTRIMTIEDFIAAKFAFGRALVPKEGRIAVVDEAVEATLNGITNLVNISNNPHFEGIVNTGFAANHTFIKNIYGFDVWTTNMLPVLTATEVLDASSYNLPNDTAEIGDIVNQFSCVADDSVKPIMHAWRRPVRVLGWRNEDEERDQYKGTSRYGLGTQRKDTLLTVITHGTNY